MNHVNVSRTNTANLTLMHILQKGVKLNERDRNMNLNCMEDEGILITF